MGFTDYFRSLFRSNQLTISDLVPEGNDRPLLGGISSIAYFPPNGSAISWQGEKFRGSMPWAPPIFKNHLELRRQARKSYLESTETRSIVGRIADLSVHTGLRLQSTPVWFLLDPKDEIPKADRLRWQRNHEQRWRLYFESKEADSTGFYSGGQLQYFVKTRLVVDGEILAVLRYDDTDSSRMSPVNIQFYNPDQLGGISNADQDRISKSGHLYRDGIEFDVFGKPVVYYISGIKIPTFGPNGRRFVIHYYHKDEVGQIRGVSPLAPILFDLSKLTGYTVAELQAAVVNASIAVWVEPGTAPSSRPFAGIKRKDESQSADTSVNSSPPQAHLTQPGILVQNLKGGEKLNSYDTKRPNVNFEVFKRAMMKYLSGSLGLPVEVVEMTFSQNYSASRATLILAWRRIEIERENDNNGFNRPWHEAWFLEEVRRKNIEVDGMDIPVRKAAWLKTDWIGISKPDIDPNKTAQARKQNLDMGLTTHEREALDYNGSEYDENIAILADENPKLAQINKVFEPNQPLQEVPIDPPDETSNGTDANQ